MGLFSANFSKEGPGIDKNEPQKKRFFLFWDIYFRKFWKLVQLNLLYVPFWIPGAIGVYFLLMGGFNLLSIGLMLISGVLLGPATAGITYVMRNFAREEHAFIFSDFKDNFKSNFKQSAIYSTIFSIVTTLMAVAGLFYYRNVVINKWLFIPLALCLGCLLVVIFMNFYMYPMIVTFRLSLRQMVKNAFIFSVLGVFTNMLTFLITGAMTVLLLMFFPVTLLFICSFALSTIQFIVTFNTYPRLKKHMIDPATGVPMPEDEEDDDPVFSDERTLPEDDRNGR